MHAFERFCTELGALRSGNMHEGFAAERTEVGDVGFNVVVGFVRSHVVRQRSRRGAIDDVHSVQDCKCPVAFWKTRFIEQGARHLEDCPIEPLTSAVEGRRFMLAG